jgi:hypothetical protein
MNINHYTIDAFDTDLHVQGWHARFLPAGVLAVYGNIFTAEDDLEGILYLNFCSITDYLTEAEEAIATFTRAGHRVFVGFSRRALGSYTTTPRHTFYRRSIGDRLKYAHSRLVSSHGDYVTFEYSPRV